MSSVQIVSSDLRSAVNQTVFGFSFRRLKSNGGLLAPFSRSVSVAPSMRSAPICVFAPLGSVEDAPSPRLNHMCVSERTAPSVRTQEPPSSSL